MKIEDFLAADHAFVGLKCADKPRVLRELSEKAAAALGLEPEIIAHALAKREELGSTGVGLGIGVPHARLAEVAKPFGLVARLKRAIDFDAIDGEPVDIVCLLLMPLAQNDQISALAAVARKLREPERLARMRAAEDAPALHQALVT